MHPFFFIRHGETEWNRLDLMQGQTDIPLNDNGRKQAESIRALMVALRIEKVFASDLDRAMETASRAFPCLRIEGDPRLREVHLGEGEGLRREDLADRFGSELIDRWSKDSPEGWAARLPGGESRAEAIARLDDFLTMIRKGTGHHRMAFVSHGMIMRLLAQRCLGRFRPELRAPNCAVFQFSFTTRNQGQRLCLNQIFHR